VVGWLDNCSPEGYSESPFEGLDRLTERWIEDYARTSRGAIK
jgi:hypothetical protein